MEERGPDSVRLVPSERVCSYCGNPLAASALVCAGCGKELPGYAERFREEAPPAVPGFMERIPLHGRPAVRILLAVLAALFAALPLNDLLRGSDFTSYLLLADLIMGAAVIACALPQRREIARLFVLPAPRWWLPAVAGALALPQLAAWYVELLAAETELAPWTGLHPAVTIIAVCIFPGIFEELAFRGIFFGTVIQMTRRWPAHLLTAAMFAGIHFSPVIFPYHFLVGLFLGWLRDRSGSLWPAMLAHGLHNAAVIYLYGA